MWCWLFIRWEASSLWYEKDPNLPLTYLPNQALHSLVVADHLGFLIMNQRSDRRTRSVVMKLSRASSLWYSPKLSLELGRNSNFDELVIAAYGCELSWRRAAVAWMAAVLLRGYRGDAYMIDGLRCYGGMYLYRLWGGWLHDRSNLVLICYNLSYILGTLTNSKANLLHDRSNLVLICYNPILSFRNFNKLEN
jgi:hypothetical protein